MHEKKRNKYITKLLNDLTKWKETNDLSLELAEISKIVLNRILSYSRKNNIGLFEEEGFLSLVKKMVFLANQIESINSPFIKSKELSIRRIFTARKSDKDFTEPKIVKIISVCSCSQLLRIIL